MSMDPTRPSSPEQFKMAEPLRRFYAACLPLIETALREFLPENGERLVEAMRYSVLSGGKRIRPILVMAAAECFDAQREVVLPAAVAIELIQVYTLIHDDLPAMDNDDYRRGRPSNHKVYGEGIAILAGDALLTHAPGLIAMNARLTGIPPERALKAIEWVSEALGAPGVAGGQALDIMFDKGRWKKLEIAQAQEIVREIAFRKTAVFIRVSLQVGAVLAGADDNALQRLGEFGEKMGEAFQIANDILGQEEDEKEGKLTYPAVFGIETSVNLVRQLVREAKDAIVPLGASESLQILHYMADYIAQMLPDSSDAQSPGNVGHDNLQDLSQAA